MPHPTVSAHSPAACGLKTNQQNNPTGITATTPRLSWRLADSRAGAAQMAYQIQAASKASFDTESLLWDSGKQASERCCDIAYGGAELQARQGVYWRVRIWDAWATVTDWSETAYFEVGLNESEDWTGQWISLPDEGHLDAAPCPHFRRDFSVKEPFPERARLYITARGLYHVTLNGKAITPHRFAPGWTEYASKIPYLVYDVGSFLKAGKNTLGVVLGDGWYRGNLFHPPARANYGTQLSLLCQLEIQNKDGSYVTAVESDEKWKAKTGPIRSSDIYDGEHVDARLALGKWDTPNFSSKGWSPAAIVDAPEATLSARLGPLTQAQETLKARSIKTIGEDAYILDFGQNLTGVARLKLKGAAGQKITLRFGEMINADGSLYTENLRLAKATDSYICSGKGTETFEPLFTYHGFRYVEISGLQARPTKSTVVAIALHSEMEETGTFECSDAMLNQLQSNIRWGQKGNFLELPTDCPQRDERLGWTGDAQVFIPTAAYNFDVSTFFAQWMETLNDGQSPAGAYPDISPDVFSVKSKRAYSIPTHSNFHGNAGWGDAGVICPWEVYRSYGDSSILERCYPHMARWIDYQRETAAGLIRPATVYGDWLAVDAIRPEWAPTPCDLIGTAYFAHTTRLLASAAAVLGKEKDAARYRALRDEIGTAFREEFVTPRGLIAGDTQTGYLLALAFDLVEGAAAQRAVDRLVYLIERRDNHLSTGFLGTPLLCPTLSRFGKTELAYRILMQRSYPGWLYPIVNGATTMWERWNSYTKEDGFGDTGMNSFNHYAYGAIGQWLYRVAAGLDQEPDSVGYKRIVIRPQPGGGLTHAKASLQTPYGLARSEWKAEGNAFELEVEIPPNTTARVHIPAAHRNAVSFLSEPTWDRVHTMPFEYRDQCGIYTLPAGIFRFGSER